jgi:hypothetical protein
MRFVPGRPRTRLLLVGGTAVACVAAVVTGTITANAAEQRTPKPRPGTAAPDARPAPVDPGARPAPVDNDAPPAPADKNARPAPAGKDGNPAPEPARPQSSKPLGAVIPSGITTRGGEIVFYTVAITEKALPRTTFGIMAGVRGSTGDLTDKIIVNETEGSDRAPGFHAIQSAMEIDGVAMPAFGYYAGPVTKITVGKVTAHQAAWSKDSSVVVFWFDPADVRKDFVPSGVAAFGRSGNRLPAGHAVPGVG